MIDLDRRLREAVRAFWRIRSDQHRRQGGTTGRKDAGNRSAVTGGKHAAKFAGLIGDVLREAGIPDCSVYVEERRILPGYFRPSKDWDVVVKYGDDLVAVAEIKSQVGSFGNNFNNRVEEALGNATDFWTAYREGSFAPSVRPWLGYLMLLEDHPKSIALGRPTTLPHYPMRSEFQGVSYARRYELFCERLVRERLYDGACFLMSGADKGRASGDYTEPHPELTFRAFALSLIARAETVLKLSTPKRS